MVKNWILEDSKSSLQLLFFDVTAQLPCKNAPLAAGDAGLKLRAESGLELLEASNKKIQPALLFVPD